MRWMKIALFLLSSLGMLGCKMPTSVSADEPNLAESEEPNLDESLPPSESDSPDTFPSDSEGLLSNEPPDPLAAEPVEPAMLKAAPKRKVWLFYYGFQACEPCRIGKPNVQAWAAKRGLTQSEADLPNARMCTVQYIDILNPKTKPQRNLDFDGKGAMFPSLVWVDSSGRELWHSVGIPNEKELDLIWGLLEKGK